jgi:hypothetical protein
MIDVLGGIEWEDVGFHHATQKNANLKFMNCLFWNFPLNIF